MAVNKNETVVDRRVAVDEGAYWGLGYQSEATLEVQRAAFVASQQEYLRKVVTEHVGPVAVHKTAHTRPVEA
ncbi:MAG TPA: hypothetical protein VLG13_00775 [Patescibacteria group bacterium]|nr:hypothetical protein [Patescibacteria group bacterium]